MSEPIPKSRRHVTDLPIAMDETLAKALGHFVVAFGRLEYMFKIAINRSERKQELKGVIQSFEKSTLGQLIDSCRKRCPNLTNLCDEADSLNKERQDFIHATIAATEKGEYVRFRKLSGYLDLPKDTDKVVTVTQKVNDLIKKLDLATGSPLSDQSRGDSIVATVSALPLRTS
jgi:hypothetical protein